MHIVPHGPAFFQCKHHLLAGTQNNSRLGNHQLFTQVSPDTDPHIHTAEQLAFTVYASLHFYHSIGIHQRIDFGYAAFKRTSPGIRNDRHLIPFFNKGKFILQYGKFCFHPFGIKNSTEYFRGIGRVIWLREKISHHPVKRRGKCRMLRLPFCQFVLGFRLLITALHFCNLHCLHRNLSEIIRCISLPDEHIFQFQFSFQQSVFRLGEFLLQTEFVQFS